MVVLPRAALLLVPADPPEAALVELPDVPPVVSLPVVPPVVPSVPPPVLCSYKPRKQETAYDVEGLHALSVKLVFELCEN